MKNAMKNTNKKGFTLVELLVVIAILAVLAAVVVVGYTSFINKAKESNDRSLVTQLNTAVTKVDGRYESMHEVAEVLAANGFDVAKMQATAKDHDILWNMEAQKFFYSADENLSGDNIWMVTDDAAKVNGDYSIYYVGTADINSSTVRNLVVYTNDPTLVLSIDAENAHVVHEGKAGTINVNKVAPNSYHEHGIVNSLKVATTGNVKIYGMVASLTITAGATVTLEAGSETAKVIVNEATAKVDANSDAVIGAVATEEEEVLEALGTIVTGAEDVIVNEVVTPDEIGDFAGGFGTVEFPYLIATPDQLANISKYYGTYKYYKVADGVTSLDLTGVGKINLHGSFDGNGVMLVNLTTALFLQVGYENVNDTIKISNFEATLNNTDGCALVRNIFNAGTTTFENITLHGYIEGLYNMGSFYNYGTANCDGVGANYTVKFVNAKSDVTLVCTSGNAIGGMLGHGFEGSTSTLSVYMDESSGYTGTMYTTGTATCYKVMAMCSHATYVLNDVETSRYENTYSSTKLGTVIPALGEDGYYVTVADGAATFVVYLNAQVTAYDEEGNKITNKAGMTWTLDKIEMDATDGKVFDLITSASIANDKDEDMGYTLSEGVLTIQSGRKDNYCEGTVRLQVNQYDANGNLIAVGTIDVYEIEK